MVARPATASVTGVEALSPRVERGERTLGDRVFFTLHDAILTGVLQPGERLPVEAVAGVLDVSPMPVREALRRLHSVGLVEHLPHRGATVARLDDEELFDVFEARLALEPIAAARAATRLDAGDRDAIGAALEGLDRAADGPEEELWEAHMKFHFAIYEAAHSSWLLRLIEPLWESGERYRRSLSVRAPGGAELETHERIRDSIFAGDPELAETLMYDHLAADANELAAMLDSERRFEPRESGG